MSAARLVSIHVGKVAPLGPDAVLSGFVKSAVQGRINITPLGVEGDEQADLSVHGGLEKAVYGYSLENYADWISDHPQHEKSLVPGGFGENFCITGLREADLCVGDVHRIGTCAVQVCQPRQPCFKLALHFSDKKLPKAMIHNGRAGWYYRVLESGSAAAGDSVQLIDRPNPDFPFTRLVALVAKARASADELARLREMPGLASQWREWARTQQRA